MPPAAGDREPSGNEFPVPNGEFVPSSNELVLPEGKTPHSPRRWISRRWHSLGATEWISLAVLAGFAYFRFLQALRPPQGIWEDSLDYEASAKFSLLSKSFWAGPRPPLAPLLWKFTGTPTSFVIAQTALAVLAWGFLALTVGGLTVRGWRRILAISVVLAFACTMPVSEWDWSILSESLALSALAAIFAFSIRFVRTQNYAGLLCAAAVFALARDEDIWTVALIGITALFVALVVGLSERKTKTRRHRQIMDAAAALGVSLIVLALIVEVPAITSQRNVTNIVDNLIVRIFPFSSRVAWFADHGMPDSAQVNQLATQTTTVPGTAPLVSPDLSSDEFTALDTWIDSDGPGTYTLWLIEHPGFTLGAPFVKPPLTFNDASGDIGFYAAPNRISTSLLERVLYPGFWGELATLAVALALLWWRFGPRRARGRRARGKRARGKPARGRRAHRTRAHLGLADLRRTVLAVGIIAALGPVSMLLAWQGDGQEVTRHMVEGEVQMRLGILLVLLIAALGSRSSADLTAANDDTGDQTSGPLSSESPTSADGLGQAVL